MWIKDEREYHLAIKVQEIKDRIELNLKRSVDITADENLLEFYRHLWSEIIWEREN